MSLFPAYSQPSVPAIPLRRFFSKLLSDEAVAREVGCTSVTRSIILVRSSR